jgi:DNA-binding GntR family transcriptional regulator
MQEADRSSRDGAVASLVARLAAEIAEGRIAAGARLTEAALAARFAVSRGPVREALRHLAAEGLVLHHRHRGAEVRRMSRAEVAALYEVREMMEGLAARLAAARLGDPAARARLAAAFRALEAAAAGGADYAAANVAFHALVVELAGNAPLSATLARLRLPALRTQFRLLEAQDAVAESQAAHLGIAAALRAGDGIAAEAAMRAHVRAAAARLQALPDDAFG